MKKKYCSRRLYERGVAALEAALFLPVFVFFSVASVELYQYYRAAEVLNSVSFAVANGVGMQRELFNAGNCQESNDICVYRTVAQDLFRPLDYASKGGLTISVYAATPIGPNGAPVWKAKPEWSCTFDGESAAQANFTSRLTDRSNFPLPTVGDTMVVAEVFYDYTPFAISSTFWNSLVGTSNMYSRFFFRPRFNDLRNTMAC